MDNKKGKVMKGFTKFAYSKDNRDFLRVAERIPMPLVSEIDMGLVVEGCIKTKDYIPTGRFTVKGWEFEMLD